MTSECSKYQQWIPQSLVGDLTKGEQNALDQHLAECPSCRREQEGYAETLQLLRSAGDEPVPRHFFVYPEEQVANPWQLFRRMMPRWQAVTAGVAAAVLLMGIVAVSGVQISSDHGAWAVSFGRAKAQAAIDAAALKAEILRTAEERNREAARAWIQDLQFEIERSRTDLTQLQRTQLAAALANLESRLDNRIALTADSIRTGTQKSIVDLYQTLSLQHEQDISALNARLDSAAESSEVKANQTDTILETLLQVANLSMKQTGEQK